MIPGELPLVQELTSTLREWAVIWRKLYVVSYAQAWSWWHYSWALSPSVLLQEVSHSLAQYVE